jgi:superfamily II DNA or RNA helicase
VTPLRPHQERAIAELRASLAAGNKRPMLALPTGAGKTLLAAHIVRNALGRDKRVAFVVPRLSLIDQTVAAFEAQGIGAIGVMQGAHWMTDGSQPVQVCSAQTLGRRERPAVDLVIIDEAHELHRSILTWITDPEWASIPFIGLSATPWSRGLGKYYDDLILAATTRGLIDQGYLSDFVAYAPSEPDLTGVSTIAGEYKQDELGDAMDKASITGDIIAEWLRLASGLPTIVFCVNRSHAQHVCERFLEAGVASEYMDGTTPREERQDTFGRFQSGETSVLCNVGVLTTGIDLDVRCVVDAQPTRSRILFAQKLGRGLRTAAGKDRLLILDCAGNHLRLGLLTDLSQSQLDNGEQRSNSRRTKAETPLPRLCPQCKTVLPSSARRCSACGEPIVAVALVHVHDGELVELGSNQSGKRGLSDTDKRSFFRELLALKKPHYKDGWIAAQFRNRFGHWPPLNYDQLAPAAPSLATRNWLKSRQIAFAKRRAA